MQKLLSILCVSLFFSGVTTAQEFPTLGKIVRLDPAFDQIIPLQATIEVVASGFKWAEGPAWSKNEGCLFFSDTKQNKIYRWHPQDGLSIFLSPSGYTGRGEYSDEPGSNGLLINAKGELVACEHGDRRLTRMPMKTGGKYTLADRWEGKRFNSPNDVCEHSSGAYYFTDPPYGLAQKEKDPSREMDAFGVYRVDSSGKVTQIINNLKRPNGVALSPDEKTLYVAQSDDSEPYIMAYPLQNDGSVGKGRIFYDFTPLIKQGLKRAPDGIRTDASGNLYAAGGGGFLILNAQGKLLGRLEFKTATSNCSFGSDGYMYLTAENYICRVRVSVPAR
ncbi:SMP-30/gluconolactonase/LRE family protein [Siphonobacter sp. SORGH_AS_0500]|uniref:SMP-30/gluconolactonase/LRE family protein n=1 Tax=Siphonobacter sp. SORGH_AS_0500 TaxID=1864824 RepID=UPI002865F8B3|nr:SMP-30/gluconolactonase/LRE family protein [Siphonobacter sp. SORGH_AS_0500]MDR6196505.1 gluconolactonase [Siphonobacter sp. SORGH_AS_0500]